MPDILCDPEGRAEQRFHRPRGGGASAALAGVVALMSVPVWLSVGYAVSPAGRHQTKHLCVCVCVCVCVCGLYHFYQVFPVGPV